jgi:hypothetical protein
MMLVARATLPEDATSYPTHGICSSRCMGTEDYPLASKKHGIPLPWDEDRKAFSACIVIPRVVALDVVARKHASAPWKQLLQMQVRIVCEMDAYWHLAVAHASDWVAYPLGLHVNCNKNCLMERLGNIADHGVCFPRPCRL